MQAGIALVGGPNIGQGRLDSKTERGTCESMQVKGKTKWYMVKTIATV